MDRAAELGMSACARTDHGNLYGAIEFYNQAKAKGIKPLIGCELYLVETSRLEKKGRFAAGEQNFHLGPLSQKRNGARNTCSMIATRRPGRPARASWRFSAARIISWRSRTTAYPSSPKSFPACSS